VASLKPQDTVKNSKVEPERSGYRPRGFFLMLAALGYQVVAENNLPKSNLTKSESSIPLLT
jgi:hypothetical protein